MKAGDKVTPKKGCTFDPEIDREIVYYGDRWVIYRSTVSNAVAMEDAMMRVNFDKAFEVPPTFFKAGETYTRCKGWSAWAQADDVTETFAVLRVDGDSDGPIAYGCVGLTSPTGAFLGDRWVTQRQYSFDHGGWQ